MKQSGITNLSPFTCSSSFPTWREHCPLVRQLTGGPRTPDQKLGCRHIILACGDGGPRWDVFLAFHSCQPATARVSGSGKTRNPRRFTPGHRGPAIHRFLASKSRLVSLDGETHGNGNRRHMWAASRVAAKWLPEPQERP